MEKLCKRYFILLGVVTFLLSCLLPEIYNMSQCPPLIISGKDEGDNLGASLACGDINGDGLDDLIIGAHLADGPKNNRENCGEVYVIYGRGELLNQGITISNSDFTIYGAQEQDFLGKSLACGDINGDGFADIIMAVFNANYGEREMCGKVCIIYGGKKLGGVRDLTQFPSDVTIYGESSNNYLGVNLAVASLNGDSLDDLVLCASGGEMSNENSKLYIIYGRNDLSSIKDLSNSPADCSFVIKIPGIIEWSYDIGDLNGDKYLDITVGIPDFTWRSDGNTKLGAGAVFNVYGSSISLSFAQHLEEEMNEIEITTVKLNKIPANVNAIYGSMSGEAFGKRVKLIHLDNDKKEGIICTAPGTSLPTKENCGAVYIYRAQLKEKFNPASLTLQKLFVIYGQEDWVEIGTSLAVGDLNGDQRKEIIVSVGMLGDEEDSRGKVYIFTLPMEG